MKSNFANRLKNEREAMKKKDPKWTQEYVADLIGVARPTYTAYERGTKQPSIDTVNRLADIFDVTSDYITGRSNERKATTNDEKSEDMLKDPNLGLWFKEIKNAPEDKQEELKKIWDIIKVKEAGRMPGDKQKD